jgi:hypothetical protein
LAERRGATMRYFVVILGMALAFGMVPTVHADPIVIFNTGVDGAGNPLPGGSADPHYSFIPPTPNPPGVGPATVANFTILNPIPPGWMPNTAVSQWISSNATPIQGAGSAGIYAFVTTFDLTGFDETTATLNINWASDPSGGNSDLLVNGTDFNGSAGPGAFQNVVVPAGGDSLSLGLIPWNLISKWAAMSFPWDCEWKFPALPIR